MTERQSRIVRYVFGAVLLAASMVVLFGDAHVAWSTKTGMHAVNSVVFLVLFFAAFWCLMPALARAFARELLEILPALGQLWPGGRRAYDPPPASNVGPPPSVPKRDP